MTAMPQNLPEPFQPERLRAGLRPLAAALAAPTDEVQAYQRYYGLDLPQHGRVHSRLGRFQSDGLDLVAQLWLPPEPKATLILLHGYYDHMGLYRHVFDWALAMNFAVLSCDLPGHGLSEGEPVSIGDFAEYQAVLAALFQAAAQLDLPRPWHLFGQSTGGAILLDYLLHETPLPGLGQSILLAPLVQPRAWGWSKLTYQLVRPFVQSIPRRFSENSGDPGFLEFLQRDPLQPRILPTAWVGALARWVPRIEQAPRSTHSPLIIQGEADMTVDWRHNLRVLQEKFAEPELLLLPQARHHLANESAALRQRYFDFLRERLARG